MNYSRHFSALATPQSEPIPGSSQVENSAGGYSWEVDDWTKLDRFLILGNEGGSYYAGEREMTFKNANAVTRCVKADGVRTVKRIVEISIEGRAPKNDPALFALAVAAGIGNDETRKAALSALPKVARTGRWLFMFLENVQNFRGWGRGLRAGVGAWYNERDVAKLAVQVVKYRQRDGWTHRDALRLASPRPPTPEHSALYRWIVDRNNFGDRSIGRQELRSGPMVVKEYRAIDRGMLPKIVASYEALEAATDADEVVRLIRDDRDVSWEMVPSQFLREAKVWEALLPQTKLEALTKNLGRLTNIGLITPMSDAAALVVKRLCDRNEIVDSRLHPVKVLAALTTYSQGCGVRGDLSWRPISQVVDALHDAFYLAFGNVRPSNKRTMLTLDLSGSMRGGAIAGVPGLTPRMGAAAMALVTAASEPKHIITGFTAHGEDVAKFPGKSAEGMELAVSTLSISSRQRLDDVVAYIEGFSCFNGGFCGTDASLPMRYALAHEIPVDVFVMYTDSQTWAGDIHPAQAPREYRRKMGIAAKLVVVGMVANEFTIADPNDAGMLDVVGFDTATPELISSFA